MGQTIVEKILSRSVGRSVSPGEYVEISSRIPSTMGQGLGRGFAQFLEVGAPKLFDPNSIRVVDGHVGATASHNAGENRSRGREWLQKLGVPTEAFYELGRGGIEHVMGCENAWALPGEIFLCIGVNGHTSTLGALGSFAFPLSYGSGGYLVKGSTWARVPETVKIVVKGKLGSGVIARDVVEYTLGKIGPSAAVGMVMEWAGPVIDEMSIDGRFTLCCNALFFGGWTGIVNPDQKTIDYVKARNPHPFDPLVSDSDAKYAAVYEIDMSDVPPQIVPPPERYHVHAVTEHEGTPINRGFIGSCANGRIEDMRLTAQILRGRKIHPDVILNITPGTMSIYKQSIKEGLMQTFIEAEAAVHAPCCGQCYGGNTPLAAGDVCVATSTCNYPGRQGSREAQIYLANPATAAASAIEGKITDPRKYL